MSPHRRALLALAGLAFVAWAPAAPGWAGETAPEPARPVDMARLFTGRWLEVARLPMALTRGCVAATTDYAPGKDGRLAVTEACRANNGAGALRSITSPGRILDPGTNARLRVSYPLFITWDFWILDHADDYAWYISGSPDRQRLFVFAREVPDAAGLAALVARVKALGYDSDRLEFPYARAQATQGPKP
jgi:apolipoprotein D and lipocalin family protein